MQEFTITITGTGTKAELLARIEDMLTDVRKHEGNQRLQIFNGKISLDFKKIK